MHLSCFRAMLLTVSSAEGQREALWVPVCITRRARSAVSGRACMMQPAPKHMPKDLLALEQLRQLLQHLELSTERRLEKAEPRSPPITKD